MKNPILKKVNTFVLKFQKSEHDYKDVIKFLQQYSYTIFDLGHITSVEIVDISTYKINVSITNITPSQMNLSTVIFSELNKSQPCPNIK